MSRSLSFGEDLFGRLGSYSLPAAPLLEVGGRWFPIRHFSASPVAGLGVELRFTGAFAVSSRSVEGSQELGTTIDEVEAGLVYELRVIDELDVEATLGYGETRFLIDPSGPARPGSGAGLIPSVHYRFVRPALAGRVRLPEGVSVAGSVGWRAVVESGPLRTAQWFPRSSSTGVDLELQLAWRFDPWLGLRATVRHTRYLTDISPEPGDYLVAGGAADEWTSATLELQVMVPGVQ